jgi:Transcriptional regulators
LHKRNSPSGRERLDGFKDALQKYNLTFSEKNSKISLDVRNEHFYDEFSHFLQSNQNIDGIFAVNDTIAMEILIASKKIGLSIPEELKLIGFDDTPQDSYSSPTLSSVHQNTPKIAVTAVDSLLNIIKHPKETGNSILIPVNLVERESSQS